MKKLVLVCMFLIKSALNWAQETEISFLKERKYESKTKLDSTYINYYILNQQDTFYFPSYSEVIQCNYLQKLDRDHNKCTIYINQKLGAGSIELVVYGIGLRSTTYTGTLINGHYLTGTIIQKTKENSLIYTGQYCNNWKFGYWTTYYLNGKVQTIHKYIEGVSEPVITWEYSEEGKLLNIINEEAEIIKKIGEK